MALTKRVDTRMTEHQYRILKLLAEESRVGIATYIRFIIQQHLMKKGMTNYEN